MNLDQLSSNQQFALAMVFMVVVGTWRSLGYAQRMWPKTAFAKLLIATLAGWTVFTIVLMAAWSIYFHFFQSSR